MMPATHPRTTALSALEKLATWRADNRDTWLTIGMAMHSASSDLLEAWDAWSKQSSKYRPGECARQWKSFRANGGVGLGTLVRLAQHDGGGDSAGSGGNSHGAAPTKPKPTNSATAKHATKSERDAPPPWRRPIETTYDYTDEQGAVLFQVVRFGDGLSPRFMQRHQGDGDRWAWNIKGVRRVLYGLPMLLAADPHRWVFVVEGEKDVGRLLSLDMVATCNPMGAGSWRDEFSEVLKDRRVCILVDSDDIGRKHAEDVARSLHGVAAGVRILELPGLSVGGDVSDWLDADATLDELKKLVKRADEWVPTAATSDSNEPARNLPFTIKTRVGGRGTATFIASVAGSPVATFRYPPGDVAKRTKCAALWAEDERLSNGQMLSPVEVAEALEVAELDAIKQSETKSESEREVAEVTSHIDGDMIAELGWHGGPTFIIYHREDRTVEYATLIETDVGTFTTHSGVDEIIRPGNSTVLVPTAADFDSWSRDPAELRTLAREFIDRYVELPDGMADLVVTYIFMTWCYQAFDELPYLAFRTADAGRGKSRALETVGTLCYLPLFVGGGSSAAATLRMLDQFKGTLVADEFDMSNNSDLGSELNKLICQGFQAHRPLLKCVGEENMPKAFQCFGPKLFAMRKVFGDDAAESRSIVVRMTQRTRRDIPISLPRAKFNSEASAIRNMMLAWRFLNLDAMRIDTSLTDDSLEDRANQIGLPLLSVAQDDATRGAILNALRHQQADVADTRSDTLAGLVLECALAIAEPDEIVRPVAIAAEINRRKADEQNIQVEALKKPMHSFVVGKIMGGDLEFPRAKRDKKGNRYVLKKERVTELVRRYGMQPGDDATEQGGIPENPTPPTPPTPLHQHPTPENQRLQLENEESVGGVGSVGSQGACAGSSETSVLMDDGGDWGTV